MVTNETLFDLTDIALTPMKNPYILEELAIRIVDNCAEDFRTRNQQDIKLMFSYYKQSVQVAVLQGHIQVFCVYSLTCGHATLVLTNLAFQSSKTLTVLHRDR